MKTNEFRDSDGLRIVEFLTAMDGVYSTEERIASVQKPKEEKNVIDKFLNEVAAIDSRIAAITDKIYSEEQKRRLNQLLLQSAMRDGKLDRALHIVGIDLRTAMTAKQLKSLRDDTFVSDLPFQQRDKAQNIWMVSLKEVVGARKLHELAGKKSRFSVRTGKCSCRNRQVDFTARASRCCRFRNLGGS